MLCFVTRVAWVCLLLCKEEGSSPVSAITERRDKGQHVVSMSMGFGIGTMRYYVVVKSMLVWNASPRALMCFRCLIFSLSVPCELLFLLCFIASWT